MRASGILMHISSLSSKYGIGTMGKEAYNFVDFLVKSKQAYWQILPLSPTSYGDSPYQSFSTHAGNPYFIDLDILCEEGLLEQAEIDEVQWDFGKDEVDYSNIYHYRFDILKKAYERFLKTDQTAFNLFLEENENWVSNYALFMSIKYTHGQKCWLEWDNSLKMRDPHSLWLFKTEHQKDVEFWEFLQFKFFEQWQKLKAYANENGIKIIGDIPIYVAIDSVDVWVSPDLFDLDNDLIPNAVAGCPPDIFSDSGQLWGNPLYNWERHKETEYNWWIERLRFSTMLYDVVRIDHFKGFESYYCVPYGNKDAVIGEWKKGPGADFFKFIENKMGKLPLIAEDLGFLTDEVITMLNECGFPGMRVLEFAFDSDDNIYLPHNHTKNCVVYVGTHDNNTILGWLSEADKKAVEFCTKYVNGENMTQSELVWAIIKTAFASVGDTAIIQMQDYLELGSEARMNFPSTMGTNWKWRIKKGVLTDELSKKIADITKTYGRCNLKQL